MYTAPVRYVTKTSSVVLLNKKYIYSYLKCIVYDKSLKPRQSFRITLYIILGITSKYGSTFVKLVMEGFRQRNVQEDYYIGSLPIVNTTALTLKLRLLQCLHHLKFFLFLVYA